MIYKNIVLSYEFLFSKNFVDGSVALTDWSDETADGDNAGLSEVDGPVFVNVADIELNWCVVLWCDQLIGVVAFSWQVEISQFVI